MVGMILLREWAMLGSEQRIVLKINEKKDQAKLDPLVIAVAANNICLKRKKDYFTLEKVVIPQLTL